MDMVQLAIGTDHRGYQLKQSLLVSQKLARLGIQLCDVGAFSDERSDYPLFAQAVCLQLLAGDVDGGILLCGSGTGMAIAANRFHGIYAAVVWNDEIARLAREDDNCNVLVLPADFMSVEQAVFCIAAWQGARFKEGHYAERLSLIEKLTK
ncbi:MAG: RpiB/LacA/LacB family sugar-phosphate isomerase [Candidatus Babeliaceae bacterium]|nr:RpiB/LacA/LacB family sugar-phosphate isomerase [Candidatus Babeliaceae bacterium]